MLQVERVTELYWLWPLGAISLQALSAENGHRLKSKQKEGWQQARMVLE